MFPQHSHPALFDMSGLSLPEAILMIIAHEPLLKARQIAYRLSTRFGFTEVVRHDVNSLLYGELNSKVKRTDDYRWTLRQRKAPVKKSPTPVKYEHFMEERPTVTITPIPIFENVPKKMSFWARVKFIFNL